MNASRKLAQWLAHFFGFYSFSRLLLVFQQALYRYLFFGYKGFAL
jgi:hypothetical protein